MSDPVDEIHCSSFAGEQESAERDRKTETDGERQIAGIPHSPATPGVSGTRAVFIQKDFVLIMCAVTFLHAIIATIVRIVTTSIRKKTVDQE